MNIEQLIQKHPLPLNNPEAEQAANTIMESARPGGYLLAIYQGIAYGIILGKRQERKKKKGS